MPMKSTFPPVKSQVFIGWPNQSKLQFSLGKLEIPVKKIANENSMNKPDHKNIQVSLEFHRFIKFLIWPPNVTFYRRAGSYGS